MARVIRKVETNQLQLTQEKVRKMLNRQVRVIYNNRGREFSDEGMITAVFNNVFVFEFERNNQKFKASFTYTDVMTGGIELEEM